MSKITYLLGAGANCNTFPLAKDLGDRLFDFYTFASAEIEKPPLKEKEKINPENFLQSVKWLAQNGKKHTTVDTFAKKLWVRHDDDNLYKLKSVLSCYFLFEHIRKDSDNRYDNFFAAILSRSKNKNPPFPPDISIITWNYDLLLEKSYFEFCLNPDFVIDEISKNSRIIRLNGFAMGFTKPIPELKNPKDLGYFATVFEPEECDLWMIIDLFNRFYNYNPSEKLVPGINFAWDIDINILQEQISNAIAGASILVIIGYSFPFFNRDVDKIVVRKIMEQLERIYIQNKYDDGSNERLLNLMKEASPGRAERLSNKIEILKSEIFFVPNEYKS